MIKKNKFRTVYFIALAGMILLSSCDFQDDWFLDMPVNPGPSILAGTVGLTENCRYAIEGIYSIKNASEDLGDTLVIKNTGDRISMFCRKNGAYFILDAGSYGNEIRLEGYWRYAFSDETGTAEFRIADASALIAGDTTITAFTINGIYGNGSSEPDKPVYLHIIKRFSPSLRHDPFIIGAHRSGGRTSDKLPVSENSVAMINYTKYFGSTGIEIDVRLTKDKIPVLYHDADLNIRLIQKGPLFGKISDYKLSQLKTMVRLIHGETIPTLSEALDAVLENPEIRFVWLDMKDAEAVDIVVPIQLEYLDKAQKAGRELQILYGIPADDILSSFTAYPGYKDIPSLCELSPEKVNAINAKAWGFRWTQGLQEQEVISMHSLGRKCFVWTLDVPEFMEIYATHGGPDASRRFDGILTNYPTVLAYYHYVRHNF